MTVVVGFHCRDGIVVGADSMLTPSIGNIGVGHHKGQKVHVLAGSQLFAFAGNQGQAARFQIMADYNHAIAATADHAINFPLFLTQAMIQQFHNTGIGQQQIDLNTVLGFEHNGQHQLCVFEGMIQPRLLDPAHYYVALGIGKLSADPFLRFLVDIFCLDGPPSVREATFLTTWAIQHVIDTNPGGVAGPIRVGVMEQNPGGAWQSRLLSDNEVDDHRQAVESARQSLRDWRDSLATPSKDNDRGEDVPPPPTLGGGAAAA
jgi:hypothetical protein